MHPQQIVRRIEALGSLDRIAQPVAAKVGKLTSSTVVKNALSGTWLGHPLHPMLTDLPIGAWMMAGVLDLTGGQRSATAARRLVGTGILAALPTAAAGLADWSDTYGPDQRVGLVHAMGVTAAVTLQSGSYLQRRRGHRFAGAALSALALGAVTASGYLGGHLSFRRGVGVNRTAFEEPVTDWVDVAPSSDLDGDGHPIRVVANGTPVMVVRDGQELRALSATCVHAGGPLEEGTIAEGTVRCPWHGSVFRLADGKALRGPAAVTQPAWQARIEDGRVLVRSAEQ